MTIPQRYPGEQIPQTNAKPIKSQVLANMHDPVGYYDRVAYCCNAEDSNRVTRRYAAEKKGFCLSVLARAENPASRPLTSRFSYKYHRRVSRRNRLKPRVVQNRRIRSESKCPSQAQYRQNKRVITTVSQHYTIQCTTLDVPHRVSEIVIGQARDSSKCGCGRGSSTSAMTRHERRRWRVYDPTTIPTIPTPLSTEHPDLSSTSSNPTMSIVAMSPEPSAPSSLRDGRADHVVVSDGGECEPPNPDPEKQSRGHGNDTGAGMDGDRDGGGDGSASVDDALVESLIEAVTTVGTSFVDVKYAPHYLVLGAIALLEYADHVDSVRTGAVHTVTNRFIEDEENERSRKQVNTSLETLEKHGFLNPIDIENANAYDWQLTERSCKLLESIPLNEDMALIRALANSGEYTEGI